MIIPNWNGLAHLPVCLDGLSAQTYTDLEIILADNGSTDGSVDYVNSNHPLVRVVQLGRNAGFSAACNAGIRAATGEFVVLLNNDTKPEPTWLERLVVALEGTPEAGFAASKVLHFDSPHEIDSVGDGYSIWRGGGYNLGAREPAGGYSEPAWVFGACAAAAAYRRSLFGEIGLFDEDFFLNFEDVDVSLRAQLAGHRCIYVPDAVVLHKRGASRKGVPPEVRAGAFRNKIWVSAKSLPWSLLLLVILATSMRFARKVAKRNVRRLVYALRLREPRPPVEEVDPWLGNLGFRWTVKAWKWALPSVRRKRREVQKTRKVSVRSLFEVLTNPRKPIPR